MIDTLKLRIHDYAIKDDNQLIIKPASFYQHNGELKKIERYIYTTEGGQTVFGNSAFYNGNVTVDITSTNPENTRPDWNYFNSPAYVTLSLPKFYRGENLKALNETETKEALKLLGLYLKRTVGIKTNINEAHLSRIDTFTNITTDYEFYNYASLFADLNLSRKERFEYAGTTFLYKNTLNQICIYDKVNEMKNSKNENLKEKYLTSPHNITRFENRLLRKQKISDLLGFHKVADLKSELDSLRNIHYRTVNPAFFILSRS